MGGQVRLGQYRSHSSKDYNRLNEMSNEVINCVTQYKVTVTQLNLTRLKSIVLHKGLQCLI